MGHFGDRFDNGSLELRLRHGFIIYHIKTVRDLTGSYDFAIAGRQRRAKLGFIRICGFMQIDMSQERGAVASNQSHQCGRLFCRAGFKEGTVGIDSQRIPTVDDFVSPRADTGNDKEVEIRLITFGFLLKKLQRTLNATGFITMDPASDQYPGLICLWRFTLQGEQGITFRVIT